MNIMNVILFLFSYCKFIPYQFLFKLSSVCKGRNIFKSKKLKFSKLHVLLNIGDFIQYWIYMDGAYEVSFVRYFFDKYKKSKGVFIDVGANLGTYSLNLVPCFEKIYAIEASSSNASFLKTVLFQNQVKNVEVYQKAILDKDNKILTLTLSDFTCGCNSLYDKSTGEEEQVQTITLDTIWKQNNRLNVRFLKIDIEGAEWGCVQGGKEMISYCHPDVWCEFNSESAHQAGYSLVDLYNYFIDRGYKAYTLKPITRFWRGCECSMKPFDFEKISTDNFFGNILFIYS